MSVAMAAQLHEAAKNTASLDDDVLEALCSACQAFEAAAAQEQVKRQQKKDEQAAATAHAAASPAKTADTEAPTPPSAKVSSYSQVGGQKEDMRRPARSTSKLPSYPERGGMVSAGESHTVGTSPAPAPT